MHPILMNPVFIKYYYNRKQTGNAAMINSLWQMLGCLPLIQVLLKNKYSITWPIRYVLYLYNILFDMDHPELHVIPDAGEPKIMS